MKYRQSQENELTCICSDLPGEFPWQGVSQEYPKTQQIQKKSFKVSLMDSTVKVTNMSYNNEMIVYKQDQFKKNLTDFRLLQKSVSSVWCGVSVIDLLRLPGLVFCIFCIYQLWSFSGQKDERVALRAGSTKERAQSRRHDLGSYS